MASDGRRLEGSKRIESPLAKYNAIGQLTCIVCNQIVKSELLWNAHINTKAHLENKAKLKSKLKGGDDTTFKKPTLPGSSASKEVKTTKQQESSAGGAQKRPLDDKDLFERKKQRMDKIINKTNKMDLNKLVEEVEAENSDQLPSTTVQMETQETTNATESEPAPAALPEGFFDDPDLDAKARGTTRTETLEAEYEAFKKAMQVEEAKSNTLIEQDDQTRELDRDLEEVDELIVRWSKIENLHKKREELAKTKLVARSIKNDKTKQTAEEDDSDEEVDLTNVLDMKLRNKKLL